MKISCSIILDPSDHNDEGAVGGTLLDEYVFNGMVETAQDVSAGASSSIPTECIAAKMANIVSGNVSSTPSIADEHKPECQEHLPEALNTGRDRNSKRATERKKVQSLSLTSNSDITRVIHR